MSTKQNKAKDASRNKNNLGLAFACVSHTHQKILQMENSLLAIFDEIPCTIAHGLWPNFGVILKISKKSNFNQNQLKFSTQHKNIYMHQEEI